MMKSRVCALGQDLYWLEAVRKASEDALAVEAIPCAGDLVDCLDRLPRKSPDVLLLVDATWQPGIERLVRSSVRWAGPMWSSSRPIPL
jgi:hypothetical protein